MALEQHLKWRELYASNSFNKKTSGILPSGVYHGFVVTPGGGMNLSIAPNPVDYPISVAVIDRGGYNFTISSSETETFAVVDGTSGTYYLCLDAAYAIGGGTAIQFVLIPFASIQTYHIVLAKLVIPADTTVITAGMIDQTVINMGDWWKKTASETVAGIVELATAAETLTGTDAVRAVHPAGLKGVVDLKAPLASPSFTGIPLTPTASADTNTTQIASTAFVVGQAGDSSPAMNGTATVGTSKKFSRDDHIHPTDTSRAPLDSPTLTGDPKSVTAAQFDNDTSIATTAFVQRALGNDAGSASVSTGTTLTAAHAGKLVQASGTGPYSITLPLVSGVTDGASITIVCTASGTITIQRQGTDQIYPALANAVTSFTMIAGDVAVLKVASGVWSIAGGSVLLATHPQFKNVLGDAGYQKLPGGLIYQWGITPASSASAAVSTSFPLAFLNACKTITFGASGSSNGFMISLESYSTSGFTSSVYSNNTTRVAGVLVQYHAIGY